MTPIARREMAAWRFSRKEMRLFLAIGYCACYCFGPVVEGLAPVLRRDSPAEVRREITIFILITSMHAQVEGG